MHKSLLVLPLFMFSALALSSDKSGSTYRVSVEAGDGFTSINASPTLFFPVGGKGHMNVDEVEGVKLALDVQDVSSGKVKVCSTFESPKGTMAPCFVTQIGEQASVTVGDLSMSVTVERIGG